MNTDKQPQTVYTPFDLNSEIKFSLWGKKHENVLLHTPEELEALLQKERREAAEKAWLNGFKQSVEGFNGEYPFEGDSDETILRDPLISELVKLFLETNYPLPQPPKK